MTTHNNLLLKTSNTFTDTTEYNRLAQIFYEKYSISIAVNIVDIYINVIKIELY